MVERKKGGSDRPPEEKSHEPSIGPFGQYLTRRNVLLALAAAGGGALITSRTRTETDEEKRLKDEYGTTLLELQSKYPAITFRVSDTEFQQKVEETSREDAVRESVYSVTPLRDVRLKLEVLRLLREEMGKFPPDFYTALGLKTVSIGESLKAPRSNVLDAPESIRGSVSRSGDLALYNGPGQKFNLLPTHFHHEIGHLLQQKVYPDMNQWRVAISGSVSQYALDALRPGNGFINNVSRARVTEDFATTAQLLMEMGDFPQTLQVANGTFIMPDGREITRTHFELMRKRLALVQRAFADLDPRVNSAFWEALASKRVHRDYWSSK